MAKRNAPIITNTEILARAVSSIDAEMEELYKTASELSAEQRQQWLDPRLKPLKRKREALIMIYRIETGLEPGMEPGMEYD